MIVFEVYFKYDNYFENQLEYVKHIELRKQMLVKVHNSNEFRGMVIN